MKHKHSGSQIKVQVVKKGTTKPIEVKPPVAEKLKENDITVEGNVTCIYSRKKLDEIIAGIINGVNKSLKKDKLTYRGLFYRGATTGSSVPGWDANYNQPEIDVLLMVQFKNKCINVGGLYATKELDVFYHTNETLKSLKTQLKQLCV